MDLVGSFDRSIGLFYGYLPTIYVFSGYFDEHQDIVSAFDRSIGLFCGCVGLFYSPYVFCGYLDERVDIVGAFDRSTGLRMCRALLLMMYCVVYT